MHGYSANLCLALLISQTYHHLTLIAKNVCELKLNVFCVFHVRVQGARCGAAEAGVRYGDCSRAAVCSLCCKHIRDQLSPSARQ